MSASRPWRRQDAHLRRLATWVLAFLCTQVLHASAQESPGSHTQTVIGPSATYRISLPAENPTNLGIRVENVGDGLVREGRLVANGKDWSSLERMLAGIITPGMAPADKVRAVWAFLREARYHWYPPSVQTAEDTDPVKLVAVYGYGFCTDVALAAAVMLEELSIPTRFWRLGDGEHDVIEAHYEGGWHVIDVDRMLFLDADNETLASVATLRADPDLVRRGGDYATGLAGIYARTNPLETFVSSSLYERGHDTTLSLRPGDVFDYSWAAGAVHDESGWGSTPPVRASAHHRTRLSADAADPLRWATAAQGLEVAGGGAERLITSSQASGALRYAVELPYVITGGRLSIDALISKPGDEIRVALGRHDEGFRLPGTDLQWAGHRLPGVFVSEQNLAAYAEDGNWPPLHVRSPGTAGRLTYRVRPLVGRIPVVKVRFYRFGDADRLRILTSPDEETWTVRWALEDGRVGYVDASIDLTEAAGEEEWYLRIELEAASLQHPDTGWTAGVQQIEVQGVASPDGALVWSAAWQGEPRREQESIDLGAVLGAIGSSAAYGYEIQVTVTAASHSSGIRELVLDTDMQAAPMAMAGLSHGMNDVVWSSEDDEAVRITHHWLATPRLEALRAPVLPLYPAPEATVGREQMLAFLWAPVGAGPQDVYQYRVQVCPDPGCRSPISTNFDAYTGISTPGPDNVRGTLDDGYEPGPSPQVTVPFGDWLAHGRSYYWRVRTQGIDKAWSDWSETWAFTVSPGPGPFSIDFDRLDGSHVGEVTLSGSIGGDHMALVNPRVKWLTGTGAAGTGTWAGDGTWTADGVPILSGRNSINVIVNSDNGAQVRTSIEVEGQPWKLVLPEGATGAFFDPEVAIANPGDTAAHVRLTYLLPDGQTRERAMEVEPMSRRTVRLEDDPALQATDVSTVVSAHDGRPLVVDRTMFWGQGAYGGHGAGAVLGASQSWYFAEGQQGSFDTFLLFANAEDGEAEVKVVFLRDYEPPVERVYQLSGHSRLTVFTGAVPDLIDRSFSVVVESSVPIFAERAMYFGRDPVWRGGHASAGVPSPRREWAFAEAATGSFFDTYLLVANPNDVPVTVRVTYLLDLGRGTIVREHLVAPRSRFTLNVEFDHPDLAAAAMSVVLAADAPVVAERSMYWASPGGDWIGGHNGFGAVGAATRWGLAEGRCGSTAGFESWLLLANPSPDRAAEVELTYLVEDGSPRRVQTVVEAASRLTVPSCSTPGLANQRFGTLVSSQNGVPLLVEQSMYWSVAGAFREGGIGIAATRLP